MWQPREMPEVLQARYELVVQDMKDARPLDRWMVNTLKAVVAYLSQVVRSVLISL